MNFVKKSPFYSNFEDIRLIFLDGVLFYRLFLKNVVQHYLIIQNGSVKLEVHSLSDRAPWGVNLFRRAQIDAVGFNVFDE